MKFHVEQVSTWDALTYQHGNEELALKGFRLSDKDMKELLTCIRSACRHFQMIETSSAVLFQCIHLFQESPYAKQDSFLQILKDALYVYYFLRCNLSLHYDDEQLMNTLYSTYLSSYGKLDKEMRKKCLVTLRKEEDNASNTTL